MQVTNFHAVPNFKKEQQQKTNCHHLKWLGLGWTELNSEKSQTRVCHRYSAYTWILWLISLIVITMSIFNKSWHILIYLSLYSKEQNTWLFFIVLHSDLILSRRSSKGLQIKEMQKNSSLYFTLVYEIKSPIMKYNMKLKRLMQLIVCLKCQ